MPGAGHGTRARHRGRSRRCDHGCVSEWFRSYGFADVDERLIIGALPLDEADVRMLAGLGVTRVLNLVEDREYRGYRRNARAQVQAALTRAGIAEQRLATEDFGSISPELLDRCAALVNRWLDQREVVYVHCRAGRQRSATVAAAALALRERSDPDSALEAIQARKPSATPLPHQLADLHAWWTARGGAAARAPDARVKGSPAPGMGSAQQP